MATRILVVDDASFIRDMVKKHLRERIPGVEVFEAPDGNRALAAFKNQSMDLVLSDWEMPNMSGDELLRTLRALPEGTDVPFVMVTSRGDRSHVVKAVEAGASDYLVKPFTPEELLRKVNKQLTRIGKQPQAGARSTNAQGVAADAIGILTGGRSEPKADRPEREKNRPEPEGNSPERRTQDSPKRVKLKGRAQLRFTSRGESLLCLLREMSTESLTGLIQRVDPLPTLFDAVVVDIDSGDAQHSVARLNGYVHSVQAAEQNPDTQVIRLEVRFVDQDDDKLEALSRYMERL